jgi:hypothetical protein
VISLVGSAFDEGRGGRDTQDVIARGRRLRRRRRAMPAFGALGVVALSASLALALTGSSGGAGGTALNVDNAAFSVHTNTASGKVTITIRQLFDPNALKQVLAKAGIRSYFATQNAPSTARPAATTCQWPGATKLNAADVITAVSNKNPTPDNPGTFVVDPSKMPSGSVLAFQYLAIGKGVVIATTMLSGEPTGCGAL